VDYSCEKNVLDNGLRVLTVPNESTSVATCLLLFGTGSRHEAEKFAGISHVLEHMFFKGTKKFPTATLLAKHIDSLGGDFNAFTSKEYTGYYIKLRAENAILGVQYLVELLSNPLFISEELDREREVILQEYDMYEDMPSEVVASRFEQVMFCDDALGRDTIGTKTAIRAISSEDLFDYKKTHYNFKNAVFVLSGNIGKQRSDLIKYIEDNLILGHESIKKTEKCRDQDKKVISFVTKPIEQSHLMIGFRAAGYDNEDRFILKFISVLLGGSMSSRMFSEVREKNGLAYTIRSSFGSYRETGVFDTVAGVADQNLEKATALILQEYRRISTELVTAEEMKIALEIISSKLAISFEDSENVANYFAMNELMAGDGLSPEAILKKYQKITASDILETTKKYFLPERLTVSVVTKKSDDSDIKKIIMDF